MKRVARQAGASRQQVDVCLDADIMEPLSRIGTLLHATALGRSVLSFAYDPEWLRRPNTFEIDPDLQLHEGETFPSHPSGVFRIFVDSAPDRWGHTLLDRRETLRARKEGRPVRTLSEWDYLLGVHDSCRMGALRFRRTKDSPFLDDDDGQAAPPLASLRELEAASLALETPGADENPHFSQWLMVLLAPGASLGGARPKANFTAPDGAMWIAKFPSQQDLRDMAAWGMVVHELARHAGLEVSEAQLLTLGARHRTFASRRFDRLAQGRRRFFVSAMTLLDRRDGETASYLELAEFISRRGSASHRQGDLRELWTRVVFNILVSNRDDHLRNHGFILAADGWRLAPAYDLNATIEKAEHVLAIDMDDPSPDVDLALSTAGYYGLGAPQAAEILHRVQAAVGEWRKAAAGLRLSREETDRMAKAFVSPSAARP